MTEFVLHRSAAPSTPEQRAEILANPVFGHYFVDHQVIADHDESEGWVNPRIEAMGTWQMHPASAGFHYGQEIFEGLKAYRHDDGSVWLFRPEANAARFVRSAERLCMPRLPEEAFVDAVRKLVAVDSEWVPDGEGEQSLYIRPFMIASEPYLGVRPASGYTFSIIASPVGAYYDEPVTLWLTPNYTRAAPGGTGEAKCGGNYAASLAAAAEAEAEGCGQVLWTDGAERKYIEECGTMNFMYITADGELVTPELNGSILPGITRDSLLKLAPQHDLKPVEAQISVDELFDGVASGRIVEALACGTAAVVTPIVGFKAPGGIHHVVGDGTPGERTRALRTHLVDIQYGRAEDAFGWTQRVV
ncbi:MAG: branched-chain amino acid aminotransferase [Propionibacterium sp.]|nr:branched-chain amino acid aminotransferase [Propionibacterium sp.]